MLMNIVDFFTKEEMLAEWTASLGLPALLVLVVVSIVVLSKGADFMIDGVVSLARRTGLPKLIIGATVISLGTTMPEMFVSVMAAWMGNPGLALGNGVGSIICDTGLIFGLTCLVTRVPVNHFILDRTGWIQVGAATLLVLVSLAALALNPQAPVLGRPVGLVFLVLLVGYLYISYRWAKQGMLMGEAQENEAEPRLGVGPSLGLMLLGLAGVVTASRLLIPTATELAMRIGVPEDIIASTLVAFGTSLPELMTAISAIRKGHPEITVGNIVGADVLNCLFVIGAAAAARPLTIPENFFIFHFPAMLFILYSFRFFIFKNRDGWFKKWQGAWILAVYVAYLVLQYAFNLGGAA